MIIGVHDILLSSTMIISQVLLKLLNDTETDEAQ